MEDNMGMTHDEFKTAFMKDLAERKRQQDKEYDNYYTIVMYRVKKAKIHIRKQGFQHCTKPKTSNDEISYFEY
jgi:hypothetical protein